jgi:hypothetical protein
LMLPRMDMIPRLCSVTTRKYNKEEQNSEL